MEKTLEAAEKILKNADPQLKEFVNYFLEVSEYDLLKDILYVLINVPGSYIKLKYDSSEFGFLKSLNPQNLISSNCRLPHHLQILISYFGRIAFIFSSAKRIEESTWQSTDLVEPTQPLTDTSSHSNVFELYEQNVGLITPLVADELKDMESQYPIAWVEEAIQLSVIYNRKSIRYISRILERWRNEGRDGGSRGNSQTVRAKDYIERYGLSGN